MNETLLKDKILQLLTPDSHGAFPSPHSDDLAETLHIDEYLVLYLIDKLKDDLYIDALRTSNLSRLGGMIITINHRGLAFLTFGGYKKLMEKERWGKAWTFTKIVAGVMNAILVLAVAIWGVVVQVKASNESQDTADREEIRGIILDVLKISSEAENTRKQPIQSKKDTIKIQKKVVRGPSKMSTK